MVRAESEESPLVWSVDYQYSPEMPDDLIREYVAEHIEYHAAKLEVPVDHMHAWWTIWGDPMDPLSNTLTIGWRSDWEAECRNKCDLH